MNKKEQLKILQESLDRFYNNTKKEIITLKEEVKEKEKKIAKLELEIKIFEED